MSSSSYLPADSLASFNDGLISPPDRCGTYSELGLGVSEVHLHTASAYYDLQWPSPQTLSSYEAELQNNYLEMQLSYIPAFTDDVLLHAQSTAAHDAPPDPSTLAQGAGALDFHAQWYMNAANDGAYYRSSTYPPALSLQAMPCQLVAPLMGEQSSHASAQSDNAMPPPSSYSAIANALAFSEVAEYTHHLVPHAFSTGDAAGALPQPPHSDYHCSPAGARNHRASSNTYSRSSSSSSSRDNSPQLVARSVARRNAPAPLAAHHLPSSSSNRWKCPYCSYVQTTRRSPDLKRHIKTHFPSSISDEAEWICCGVPLEDAHAMGVPQEVLLEEVFVYGGQAMVGGCRKVFSRRDALKRHLVKRKGFCYGDALAPYLQGNKVGASR
ncbi:hypothetical protein FKP32DRAFT_1646465 [Trametes sanguinea]|nr:hypothetical protein FKP32DRAFT_1646465 [Trametes sanguinea]